MCLVSIIVPIFNAERYLEECIQSLINQTYSNVEIILIDDESKDESLRICRQFAQIDKRIKIFQQKNSGAGAARNTGLRHVNGKYVMFVDADDYVSPEAIEKLLKFMKDSNADTGVGSYADVDCNGTVLREHIVENEVYRGNGKIKNDFLMKMVGSAPECSDSIRVTVWNSIYSLEIINNYKLKFVSEREMLAEDTIFNIEYYSHSKTLCTLNKPTYYYRENINSLTRKKYKDGLFSKLLSSYFYQKKLLNDLEMGEESQLRLKKQIFIALRVCLQQELPSISQKTFKEAQRNIRKIICDETVQSLIKDYPIKKTQLKQKIFLTLAKNRQSLFLLIMLEIYNKI